MDMVDILFYVHPSLSHTERDTLEENLRMYDGVLSAHFTQDKQHLLTVAYNPERITSAELLQHVDENGVEASWIGL